ncbi:MAG TPA: helix-turn-helix transcriptional regulator [Flavobacteriales bacterium]|nr:helix-turn-helix transcriptional regulator [Flavobacteriales bacterium]HMR28523.1 helix-turn-helix transcriptional regulator [Flavobacteriales bacterium]
MSHLASNLKLLRAGRGRHYTQDVVAAALGISRQRVSTYESGGAEPDTDLLLRIARLYRVSVDRLIGQDMAMLTPAQLREAVSGQDHSVLSKVLHIPVA